MTVPSPKPFNITLLHPAGFNHSLALKEAADYLHAIIAASGYRSYRTTNHIVGDAYNVIFCAHLLKGNIGRIPRDSIVFNSEALEDAAEAQFYSDGYRDILGRFFVWDYSSRNLPLIPHGDKAVIPFFHCASLRRSGIARIPGPGLLFYGRLTERRKTILNDLRRHGVPVQVVFGEYETPRDVHMLGAWAVLNLHKHDDTRTFEPIRCFYPLINDVPVISEAASDASAEAFENSVFFFDSSALVGGISALYHNRALFEERSRGMLAEFKRKDPLPMMMAAIEQFLARQGARVDART
jgi:hypothetical protein